MKSLFPSLPGPAAAWRTLFTILLAVFAAELCVVLRTPLPWMIGPLLVTAAASMLGAPTESWIPFRNSAQWAIGTALGLYFTPQVVTLVWGLWWVILAGIAWALALGTLFGLYLHRVHSGRIAGLNRATSYFASPIGAASEMTLMAERHGARTDLVASAHSLRVVLVTLIIPFGLQWSGLHGIDTSLPGPRVVHWPGLALLLALTGAGCWFMRRLGGTNPWFIGALLVSIGITASGWSLSALPTALVNAAQLLIGVSLGVRFTRDFIHSAPLWLASVAAATVVMMLACGVFAVALAWATGIHPATLLLGTSPGGIAEMSITAKLLQLGVPLVTALHVTRLAGVLMLTEPIYRALRLR